MLVHAHVTCHMCMHMRMYMCMSHEPDMNMLHVYM